MKGNTNEFWGGFAWIGGGVKHLQTKFVSHCVHIYAMFVMKPTYNHGIFIPDVQLYSTKILFGRGGGG